MKAEEIIHSIMNLEVFEKKPPVLLDIGASGQIHAEWQQIAKYSVCLAFDADDRDFKNEQYNSGYKKLVLVNAIVSDIEKDKTSFYLTASPHCSSSLEPLNNELEKWSFSDLFKLEKVVELRNISISKALSENKISYVDWFKTDSQGIDLRLFKHLGPEIQRNVLVAEFEPGFINAYDGEDNIPALLAYMDAMPFWLSDFNVKGSQRIGKSVREKYSLKPETIHLRNSACWAEITYLNKCLNFESSRDLLLGLVFSIIKGQFGFALELLNKVGGRIEENLFSEIEKFLLAEMRETKEGNNGGILARIKKVIG